MSLKSPAGIIHRADPDGTRWRSFKIGLETVLNAFRDRYLMSVFTVIKTILYTVLICFTLIDSGQIEDTPRNCITETADLVLENILAFEDKISRAGSGNSVSNSCVNSIIHINPMSYFQ